MRQVISRVLIILATSCMVNCTVAGSSADNVMSNTVAYWPFDEGLELAEQ